MLKWFAILLIAALWCVPAHAQQPVVVGNDCPPGAASATSTSGVTVSCVLEGTGNRWVWKAGGTGGSGTPAGAQNTLQKNNPPGTFAASSITDNGTTTTFGEDTISTGPNPRFDIRAYGAVFGLIHTTGSINASSTTLTTVAAFAAGMGITVRGAGPNVAVSTPSAPTVSPATAGALVNTKVVTSFAGGGTTYQYQVVAEDIGGGLSAASAVTSIANGPASLGKQTATVSSWTRANNVMTVNATAAETIQVGTLIQLTGNDEWSNGTWRVAAVNSNTQFTVTTGLDTRSIGVPASGGGGGTITWFQCNHITIAHVANAFRYYIYGRTAGSMVRIGETLPDNTTVNTDFQYNSFDDFGSSMTIAPPAPDFVPSTPPGSAKNQDLTTTVVSVAGGGTTLTLAAAASNTVAGAVTRMDAAPALLAAAQAAYAGAPRAGIVLIPSNANGNFETNSILNFNVFPNIVTIEQAGGLQLGDTITGTATIIWKGQSNPLSCPSFTFECYPLISSNTADPLIYAKTQTLTLSHLAITGQANDILVVSDGNAIIPNNQFDHVAFSTPTSDFTSVHLIYRGGNSSSGSFYNWVSFTPGEGSTTNAPVAIGSFAGLGPGETTMTNIFTTKRGFYGTCGWTGTIDWFYGQGLVAPYITLDTECSASGTYLEIRNMTFDTTNTQAVAYLKTGIVDNGIIKITGGQGIINNPLVTGPGTMTVDYQAFPLSSGSTQFSQSGQNVGSKYGPVSTGLVDGSISTAANGISGFKETDNFDHSVGHSYNLFVESAQMAPPTCSVIAGGSLAVQAWTVFVAPVYANNAEGMASRGTSCGSTSSGNQTLQIGWSVAPGAIGYEVFANSGTGLIGTFPMVSGGSTTSVNVTSDFHGFQGQNAAGSGSAYMASDIVSAPTVQLSPGGGGITNLTAAPWIWTGPSGSCGTPPSVTSTSGSSLCLGDANGAVNSSFNGDAWKKLLRTGDALTPAQAAPNMNKWYLVLASQGCNGLTNCTAINADGNAVTDVTSNSTTTVTCPNNDCNFTSNDSFGRPRMKVGQKIWATTAGSGAGVGLGIFTTYVCPVTTVASFTAQSVVLNLACTASGTANVSLFWGDDDGATLNGISLNCVTYELPSGVNILTSRGFMITLPACATTNTGASLAFPYAGLSAPPGNNGGFWITPDFNYADCTGHDGVSTAVCIGTGLGETERFLIYGTGLTSASNSNCANAANKVIFASAIVHNIVLAGICPGETGLVGVDLTGADELFDEAGAIEVGSTACQVQGSSAWVRGEGNDCHNILVSGGLGLNVGAGATYVDHGSIQYVLVTVNGTLISRGSTFQGLSGFFAVQVNSGGSWLSDGDHILCSAGGCTSINSGGSHQTRNTKYDCGGTCSGITVLAQGNGGTFIDQGGNTFNNTAGISGVHLQGVNTPSSTYGLQVVGGICQGTATSSVTLGLYGAGQLSTPNCTSTTVNVGTPMTRAGTLVGLGAFATHVGVNASSGVVTVLKNGSATTLTCTLGTTQHCEDSLHTASYAVGDVISIQFTTQAAEVLAGVNANVLAW